MRAVLFVGLAVASLMLGGCGATADRATGSGGAQAFVAGDGSIVTLPAADRRPAPDLNGTTLDDKPFSLAQQRGHVVVLNVWASWCAPCRSEAPALAQVSADDSDIRFVGLVTRDSVTSARAFVDRSHVDYPHVIDSDGRLQLLFHDTLPPQAIPSTLVIDKQGRVAARVLGEVTAPTLRSLIGPLAAEADGPA
jgi:thiol-disulfide isomerase/thioredoxin